MLTFSPCESFLPVYLSGVPYGWPAFALLSVTLAVATLGSMMLLAWITSFGIERIRLEALERNESLLVGLLLCILGIAILFLEH
jgi:nickel/cobalt exporter